MVDPLVVAMFLVLGPIALVSIALAVRNPLPFRIARRNIRRARARTILVLLGLLIATATIAGSLVVGDTVRTINVHYTYLGIGYTDEGVYTVAPDGGYLYFPQAVAQSVANSSAGIPNVAGANPLIIDEVQVVDRSTSIIETNLNLVGANASASAALKPFTSTTGGSLAAPDPGKIFVDSLLAGDLGAKVGDAVVVYGLQPVSAVIQAIVQDDVRGGVLTAGLSGGTVFTDLATAQQVENAPGRVNYIAVTNAGSQVDGIAYTQAVSSSINETLQTVPGASMLSVHNVLQGSVATAESESENTVAAFLAFGMFSILAGAMLIVGIFAMIAEERKGELGVLRAIGVKRGDIILSYFFEGLIYSAGAALVGTFVGVLSGYALMVLYTSFVPNSVVSGAVIVASFTYSDSSLVISYMVGFLLTLATVLVASFRVSRLNIVRAIRDVPEPPPPLRTYSYLAGLGVAALAAGGLLFAATVHATSDVSWPTIGGALLILGAGRSRPGSPGTAACSARWGRRSSSGSATSRSGAPSSAISTPPASS